MTYKEIKAQLKEMDNKELSQLSFEIWAMLRDQEALQQEYEREYGYYCIENANVEKELAFS